MSINMEKESDDSRSDIDENFDDASGGDFTFESLFEESHGEIKREKEFVDIHESKTNLQTETSEDFKFASLTEESNTEIKREKEFVDIHESKTNLQTETNKTVNDVKETEDENDNSTEQNSEVITESIDNKEKNCRLCKYFYTIGKESFIVHSQEPWPKDVKLFQPYEIEQILLPDNANCLAVQAFLKMCNLDFQIESRPNAEFMSPTGKVPFIKCGAFVVSELEGIVHFVGEKGISLSEDLELDQKSDLRAYMALINNVLGNAESYMCWCDGETYREVTKPRNGSVYPWPLNLIQTWTKRCKELKRLKTLGWYDKTLEDVFEDVRTCCQALTDRLENNTYFFGNKFTELDALTYGHLFAILHTCLPADANKLAFCVKKYDKLVNLYKRIDNIVMGHETDFTIIESKETDEKDESAIETLFAGEPDIKGSDWIMEDTKVEIECIGDGP